MEIDVQARVASARGFFMEGCSCSQSVVLAFQDILGVDEPTLRRLSIGLGAGVGRLREVCGTVGAMAMVAGTMARPEGKDNRQQKSDTYAIVQQLAGQFREQNGSIVCRELLAARAAKNMAAAELTAKDHGALADSGHVPQERTEEYYRSRPCLGLVECSAKIIAEYIAKNY